MNFPKLGWLGVKLLAILLVPALFYVLLCQSILNHHLKNAVTNDPEVSLNRSLATVKVSLDEQFQKLLAQAVHTAEKERLVKSLTPPAAKNSKLKNLGKELADSLQTPLFVLANKKGGALYDTLDLVQSPTPTSLPSKSDKKSKKIKTHIPAKTSDPSLYSVKDWPGFVQAWQNASSTGLFNYEDRLFLAASVPILSKQKIVGALMIGVPLNAELLQKLKKDSQNDIAFYMNNKIQFSTFPASAKKDTEKTASTARHSPIVIASQNYLWDEIAIPNLEGTPAGHWFIFQPSKQSITVEGFPQKIMKAWGIAFVILLLVLGSWFVLDFFKPLRQIASQVDQIKDGNWNVDLPVKRGDEWGSLARSLDRMLESLKEKERVSLILGKVVSPQAAKKILAEKDYFALKGERRECTLLQADLKGFNTLSENMSPEALVEALNQYFNVINEVVFKYEGMLDKFLGDTALAVWGAPFNHEDKEFRAVKASLEIQEALKEFNISRIKKGHPPFTLGIGIHTGTLVSGNLGSEKHYDYSIIGEPLHVVARLCAMAAPGQIIVSAETCEKVKSQIKMNPTNPIVVKGSMEPLKTYEIGPLS